MSDNGTNSFNIFWMPFRLDTFEDPRIKILEKQKDGYMVVCTLFKLWCIAAKINNEGMLLMPGGIAHTEETLSATLGISAKKVNHILAELVGYKFLSYEDEAYIVNDWSDLIKYAEENERKRQKHKEAQERYREKEKKTDKEKQHLAPYHKEFKDTEEPKESVPMPDSMKARYKN